MASSVPSSPSYFFGTCVQVDVQAVGQLADGHGYAACAEIVAALDQPGDLPVAEQPLDLPLLGRVALLHLRSRRSPADCGGMALGGAGGAAAAVPCRCVRPAGSSRSPGAGAFTADYIVSRRRADHRADLHALGDIAGMIDLVHHDPWQGRSGCHRSCNRPQRSCVILRWGSLPGSVSSMGRRGICRAGDAHGLIDIAAAGQRVADRAADAGGRTAEGLDLCRDGCGSRF